MKKAIAFLAVVPAAFAVYTYYYSDNLTIINTSNWWQNGALQTTSGGLYIPDGNGGSLISKVLVPDGTSDYEVKATLTLASSGGVYSLYFRGTSDASITPGSGTFYAIELQNPTFSGPTCTGTLVAYKRSGGILYTLGVIYGVACRNGMTMRVMTRGTTGMGAVYLDNMYTMWIADSELTTGKPGVGGRQMPSGNSINLVQLGPLDRVAPPAINPQSISTSVFPTSVDMQWQGVLDDANGVGVAVISVHKNGAFFSDSYQYTFADTTLAASTSYTYTLWPCDYHMNCTPATFNVTTPVAGAIDPRRIGVRPTGAYWGAMGEEIDVLSGNLNYTMPLLKAQGRGGWGVTFSLNYNSQNWRKDGGGTWKLGRDVGYGFGWRLMAGAITPYYSSYWTVHHWLFTDSTGAEYKLDVNTNGVWTSKESIYVSYDANAGRLYFPDGSFWVFGSIASGTEQDAGTRYPTLMQDTNGNQVKVRYKSGTGVTWVDSSARIDEIEDVRATASATWRTYTFSYNTDTIPHLTGISNWIGTGETYALAYSGGYTLLSPFAPNPSFGSTTLLSTVTGGPGAGLTHSFYWSSYGGLTTGGELTQVTFPYQGYLRWTYRDFTYTTSTTPRTLREVQYRYLAKSATSGERWHFFWRDDAGDAARPVHFVVQLSDDTASSEKCWYFWAELGTPWAIGLLTNYWERHLPSYVNKRTQDFLWTLDAVGNPYVYQSNTILDPASAAPKQSRTEQSVNTYGNVEWTKVYDFGNLTTPARTYNNTYVTNSNYTSRFIRNRLLTTTVNNGGTPVTLVSNTYDCCNAQDKPGIREHDTANYGTTFLYRGNVTLRNTPGHAVTTNYDITGTPYSITANGVTTGVTTTTTTNYAAPSQITVSSLSTSMTWNSFLGLTQETGPNGDTGSLTYDAYARPGTLTSPFGAQTTHTYSSPPFTPSNPPTKTGTTNGRWTKTTYDGLGRTIKVETGYSTNIVSVVDTEYDSCACSPLGKVKRVSQPHANGATPNWTTYTYDALGRTLSVTHPTVSGQVSGVTNYVYEGNTVKVTDPAGKWKKMAQDAMGNLTSVTEPELSNPSGQQCPVNGQTGLRECQTNYTYNLVNQLLTVSMPRGSVTQTRTFTYDSALRLWTAANPESGTVTYTYNSAGKVATKTDARNLQVTYTYDTLGRLTQVQHPATSCGSRTFSYDSNPYDGSYSTYASGRLAAVSMQLPAATVPEGYAQGGCQTAIEMYGYSPAGAVTKKRLRVTLSRYLGETPVTGTADLDGVYTYDNEGKMTGLTYPGGPSYTYAFDSMGRPNKLSEGATDHVWGVTYGIAGQLTGMQWGGNPYGSYGETRTYNERLQMTQQSVTAGFVVNLEYRYSATANNGRVTSMKNYVSGEEVTYQYDEVQRLVSAVTTGPEWGLSFSYDGFGNRLAQTVTKGSAPSVSLTYNGLTNRLTGAAFGYDAAGNMTAMNAGTPAPVYMTYDADSRVATAYGNFSGTYYYGYAADNKRIYKKKVVPVSQVVSEEVYFYSPMVQKLGAYGAFFATSPPYLTLSPSSTNLYFAGRLVKVNSVPVVTDRLGSVVHNISSGARSYYPYGEERVVTANNTEKFGTYFRDTDTNLDYADQRYFSSQIGRFNTPDPYRASGGAGNPNSWNRYAYVEGDPVNRFDPTGLYTEDPMFHCLNNTWRDVSACAAANPSSPYSGMGTDMCTHPTSPCHGQSTAGGGGGVIGNPKFLDPANFQAEACTFSLHLADECGDGNGVGLAGTILARNGYVFAAVGLWQVYAQVVGRAGERIVGNILNVTKNTSTSLTGTMSGISRIPDFIDPGRGLIVEVKNMANVSFTAQIRDMAFWSRNNPGWNFQLWVNRGAELSKELKDAVAQGLIDLQYFGWP